MSQEIGFKLKADTSDALKSVKDLERAVNGLDSVKSRGQENQGFLSEVDLKRFRKMSSEAENIYRNFITKHDSMKRELERRKQDLDRQLGNANTRTEADSLRRELARVNSQSSLLDIQNRAAGQLRNRQLETQGQVGGMQGGNASTMLMGGMSKGLLTTLAGTLAFSQLFGLAKQGMGMVKSEEAYMSQLGNRMGGYNGNYDDARKDSMETGLINGYKSQETMALADQFTSLAGSRSKEKSWRDVQDIQTSSRALGVDAGVLATAGGGLSRLGTLQDGDQRKFANLIAGAIKKEGMQGRDEELITAVSSMASASAANQVNLSKSQLDQLVGFQSMLGSKEEGWKGQRGADIATSIDSGIKGGDSRMDLLLGWGSEFQGVSGRADLERMKAKGITDPENVKRVFGNIDKVAGGNKDYQSLMISEMFGISVDQADRLLQDDIMGELKKGGMSKKDIDELIKSGDSSVTKKSEDYQGSKSAQRDKTDAKWEKTKKAGGEVLDNFWRPVSDFFTGLDPAAQWGAMGAGATGLVAGGGKLLSKATSKFGSLFGGGGGSGAAASAGGIGSKIAGGASKLLGPLGFITGTAYADDKMGDFSDWFFGHSKGQKKNRGIFDPRQLNPWDDPGTYKEDKAGALGKFFGWESDDDYKTKTQKKGQQKEKDKEILGMEAKNLDKKQALLNTEAKLKSKDEANLKQLKSESTDYTQKASLKGDKENKGFFGRMVDGFKSLFGLGGGGEDASASQQGYYSGSGSATGSGAKYRNMSLKSGGSSMTADQVNKWINSKAPKNSLLRGQGAAFVKASQESGLDVRYLVAHAAHETGWGTSNIAKKKGNFYGIGAFDNSPMASAYKYGGTSQGIIEGAKWISKNYANKGQDTLYKMRNNNGKHEYATDPGWDKKIAAIMAGAPTSTLNVKVSGTIKGLTASNNKLVAQQLSNTIKTSKLSKNITQGHGGRA